MTRRTFLGLGLFLLVLAAVQGLQWSGGLSGPDNFYHDLWHQLAGVRHAPQHVVIVAVGDKTLATHPDEPLVAWTPYWAQAVRVLRALGAGAIGLDYQFSVSLESWLKRADLPAGEAILNFDRPFKEQLASGAVVVAGKWVAAGEPEQKRIVLPVKEFTAALPRPSAGVGLINLVTDQDGAVRTYVPAMQDDGGAVLLSFSQLLAARFRGLDPEAEIRRLQQDPRLRQWSGYEEGEAAFPRIGFVGPPGRPGVPTSPENPGAFPRIAFDRLLAPEAEEDEELKRAVAHKVVIVAYEPGGSQDLHLTPYAQGFWLWPGEDMSGAEIHANIVETILSGRAPREISGVLAWVMLAAFLAAGLMLFFRLSWGQGLAGLAGLGLLSAGLSYVLFLRDLLLPVAPVQVGLVLGYVGVLGLRLTGEERERVRLRQIFGRYVSAEVVESLLASGARPNLGGDAYRVTVLFSDIRNFTAISENLTPAQVVDMLNTYFSRAIEPILAAGGMVDKFVGDAIMAVFGAPAPHPDHARRAVQAALGLAAVAWDFQDWMAQRFPDLAAPAFRVGVGLHTGDAIVGNIGSDKRLEFTAIGDTVNTASRLEGLSKDLGWTIVASRATLEAAGPGVVTGDRQTLQVKGRRQPVEVWEILELVSG